MIVERNKVTAIATLSDWLLKPTNFLTNDTQIRNQVIVRTVIGSSLFVPIPIEYLSVFPRKKLNTTTLQPFS